MPKSTPVPPINPALAILRTKHSDAVAACASLATQRDRGATFQNQLRDKHIAAEAVRDACAEMIKEIAPPAPADAAASTTEKPNAPDSSAT